MNEKENGAASEEGSAVPEEGTEEEEPLEFESPLDAAIRERDELKSLVQRVQADFVNYRNRVSEERDEIRRNTAQRFALRFLEAVDQFDAALAAKRPEGVDDSWYEGFEGIRRALLQALATENIEPFDSEGESFDPRYHEALLTAESADVPANTVLNVLRTGYKMGDSVIRAAQVQISTTPTEPEE